MDFRRQSSQSKGPLIFGVVSIFLIDFRSSCSSAFCRIAVLKKFANFAGKHLRQSRFSRKVE